MTGPEPSGARAQNFIRDIIDGDLQSGKHTRVVTRFPPEPNGYLHIGHAKAICLNFGLAADYGGACHLRFDDTNPETEDLEYVEAIQRDVRWLGFDWGDKLFFASDYFDQFYQHAEQLVERGRAYVDSLDDEQIREHRGTLTTPGKPSPYRGRSVDENLDLLRRMRAGEFPDGAHVLRGHGRSVESQHEDAGPAALPHPPRRSLPDRQQVVHLPDVRLRPSAVRRDRGHHPLGLHARVREQPRAVRLGAGRLRDRGAAAADRVRPPPPGLHDDQQAPAAAPRRGAPGRRLGRSAHADPGRPAPPRGDAGGDPRLLRPHRRGAGQQPRQPGQVRLPRARRPQPPRPARDGGAAAAARGAGGRAGR